MISVAVSVSENHWERWLETLSNLAGIRTVEVQGGLLAEAPALAGKLESCGLRVSGVTGIMPRRAGEFLTDSPWQNLEILVHQVTTVLQQWAVLGIREISLDLDLETLDPIRMEPDLNWRVLLVRRMLAVATENNLVFRIPVRVPPARPDGRDLSLAANLIYEVMHPACRLELNLFPGEMAADLDHQELLRSGSHHLQAVRFHFEPSCGDLPGIEHQRQWAQALRKIGFKGTVVYVPRVTREEGIDSVCRELDRLAVCYRDVG